MISSAHMEIICANARLDGDKVVCALAEDISFRKRTGQLSPDYKMPSNADLVSRNLHLCYKCTEQSNLCGEFKKPS